MSDAYDRLNEAIEDVDSWHSKANRSPLLFGNKGKTIPKHSLFGQSLGDRDAAMAMRGEAAGDIDCLKRERGTLNREFEKLNKKIMQIRSDRLQMYELINQGYSYASLEIEVSSWERKLCHLSLRKRASIRRGKRVLQQELVRNEVPQDWNRANQMLANRKEALRQFMSPERTQSRRQAFYEKWFHNRAGK